MLAYIPRQVVHRQALVAPDLLVRLVTELGRDLTHDALDRVCLHPGLVVGDVVIAQQATRLPQASDRHIRRQPGPDRVRLIVEVQDVGFIPAFRLLIPKNVLPKKRKEFNETMRNMHITSYTAFVHLPRKDYEKIADYLKDTAKRDFLVFFEASLKYKIEFWTTVFVGLCTLIIGTRKLMLKRGFSKQTRISLM